MISKLKQALIEKSQLSRQAIERRRDVINKDYGPMSDDEAYGVMGHMNEIDVAKYLDSETLAKVRDLCSRIKNPLEKETKQKCVFRPSRPPIPVHAVQCGAKRRWLSHYKSSGRHGYSRADFSL